MDGRESAPDAASLQAPQLRTLLVCDIADSTALVENLGDSRSAQLVRKHDRLARALLDQHGGREIDKTDGFLLLFERPIHAVAFALDYQRGLRHLSAAEGVVLRARVGIHVGDVVVWENSPEDVARGAKPIEVEGFAKPVAARIAELALPTQVLLSGTVAALTQRAQGELGGGRARVRWRQHGRYRFKGAAEAVEIVEVGEEGLAPLRTPPSGRNARREVPWWRRPAALAAEAVLLAVAIGAGGWIATRSRPALAFAARDWVVVAGVDNRSGLPRLDDALDSAMRVGLSQSQYVNVMPDMEMQDTLKRMRRPPDARVGRRLGIEIAQRQGARAVIVPTLTAVGGRIQVAAEVVNPQNGATVYSDAATARDANQLLPATDRVLAAVRRNLGESLASIGRTAAPLADITTSNLDALRAYAKAQEAIGHGQIKDGLLLLQEALLLDPNFAMAWLRLGTIQLGYLNQPQLAYSSFTQAKSNKARLSLHERLYLEGMLAYYRNPAVMIDKWTVATQLYPDDVGPQQNLGLVLLWYENRPRAALKHFLIAANSRSPLRGISWIEAGVAQTEIGDIAAARASFAKGRSLGVQSAHFEDIVADLAARNIAAVRLRFETTPVQLPAPIEAENWLRQSVFQADRGRFIVAKSLLQKATALAVSVPNFSLSELARIKLAVIALDFATHDLSADKALRSFVTSETARLQHDPLHLDGTPIVNLALAAMLAARHDDLGLAQTALAATRANALDSGYYSRAALWRTADCETRFAAKPQARISCLLPLIDGREYYQTHVALMRAYEAAKDDADGFAQAQWLAEHRGVAAAEMENLAAQMQNLLDSDHALLVAAKLAFADGNLIASSQYIAQLRAAWNEADTSNRALQQAARLASAISAQQEKDHP